MPDTGWISPASAVSEALQISSIIGTWTNPTHVSDGDFYTPASFGNPGKSDAFGQGFVVTQFGLAGVIPDGAVIDGIEFRYYEHYQFDNKPTLWLEIICPGLNGTDYANQQGAAFTVNEIQPVPFNPSYSNGTTVTTPAGDRREYVLGSATDLWITGVEYSHVAAAGFGFAFIYLYPGYSDNSELFEVAVKVHYTGGASDPMSVRDGGVWKTASPFVRDGGIWKPATPSTRDGGIWKAS